MLKAIPVSQIGFRKDATYTSHVYLHGEIQEDWGYDLVHLDKGMPDSSGIFVINLEGFSDRILWGFCWEPLNRVSSKVMLIVDSTCQEDMEFARMKFTTKGNV